MSSSPPANRTRSMRRRQQQQQRATANSIIVIDSDSDDDGNDGLGRKPPATGGKPEASGDNPTKSGGGTPCISLLDCSSDEENHSSNGGGGTGTGGRARGRAAAAASALSPASKRRRRREEAADRELAERLQAQEDLASRKASPRKESAAMKKSSEGRAVLAVQEIIALVKKAKETYIDGNQELLHHFGAAMPSVEAVTIDDMVFFATNMLNLQDDFLRKQVPGFIGAL